MRPTFLAVALVSVCAAPAAAQQLTLAFNDGLVTIDATAVPVRTILAEWANKGGTKVVGVERVTGAPLTVKLVDVPEAKALDVILRSAAGYMAAPRSSGTGASKYDRILVMATSSAPAAPAPAARPAAPNPATNGTQRFIPPQRNQAADEDDAREDDPTPPNPPVFTFPGAPGPNGQPVFGVNGQPLQQAPPMIINPGTGTVSQPMQVNPPQPAYPPAMPFGSSTPGVISAPPSSVTRPPGGRQQ